MSHFAMSSLHKKSAVLLALLMLMAEAKRFELLLELPPLSVFKTDPFNRLGTPPHCWWSMVGLNHRPNDYKSFALTTALMDHYPLLLERA